GHCREKNIRTRALDVMDCFFDILEFFSFVAPHQEHSRLNPSILTNLYRVLNLRYRDTSLHGVQHALRPAFGAYPDAETSKLCQQIGNLWIHSIRPGNALEWDLDASASHFRCKLTEPSVMNRKHIVGNPEHVGAVALKNPFQLINNRCWFSASMGFS